MKMFLAFCTAMLICALPTVHAATLCSGVNSPLVINLASGTRTSAHTETIRYSTAWETSVSGAQAVIAVNGETVNTASGSGAFAWTATRNGIYTLTHSVMDSGQQVGTTLTATFEVVHCPPDPPVITPADGTILEGTANVTMLCATEGATIHYTTDGSEPTADSPEYRRFRVSGRTTVKAIAVKDGLCSEVAVAEYALGQCAAPVIAASSSFTGAKTSVTLSCATESATIRYTLDGGDPNSHSTRYTGPFEVTNSCTVKTYATYEGFFDSAVSSFAIQKVWCIGDAMGDPDQPFTTGGDAPFVRVDDATAPLGESMKSGAITHRQSSTLSTTVDGPGTVSFQWKTSCEDSGGEYDWDHAEFEVDGDVVEYLDGESTWLTVSREISGSGPHALVWRYTKDDISSEGEDCCWVADFAWETSSVPSVATPTITAASTFTGSKTWVTLSCATEGAIIRYTTNGSNPNSHSKRYAGPFTVTNSCTVKAFATCAGYLDSSSAAFSIEKVWGIGDTMGAPDHAFSTGGNLPFVRVDDATAPLGESMKSGAITHGQSSTLSTTVMGPGTILFQWKTSCEDSGGEYDWDHAEFEVDGDVVEYLEGVTAWQAVSHEISGSGPHTLLWRYKKDNIESDGEDCCWVADYHWASDYTATQTTPEPVPYAWLRGYYPEISDEYEAYEAAALATARNGRPVWECYVAGLDPTDETDDFIATIEMINGVPQISVGGRGERPGRVYTVEGKENLGDSWGPTNATSRFFHIKARVE